MNNIQTKSKIIATIVSLILISSTTLLTPAQATHIPYSPGDVFAGVGNGKINHYTSAGLFLEQLETTSGSSEETGMCFDAAGNLYTTNWTSGTMSKFDNMGGLLTHPWGGPFSSHPETCVVDAAGNIYVGEVDGANLIRKFNSAGTLLTTYSPLTQNRGIDWMDLAADQCTMYYTSEGSSVKRFDVCTNTQLADFATGLASPCFALRIRSNGEVMVACASQVVRLDSTGATAQTYPTSTLLGASSLFAMNMDPSGSSFWTGDYSSGNIYEVDIATGAVLTTFTAPPQVFSMAGLGIFGEPIVSQPENCTNGLDDDNDGLVDGQDPDCQGTEPQQGRMTGGGSVFTGSTRVTHGFELHCDATSGPNTIEVNWDKGNKFHLESVSSVSCSDDPSISEGKPVAGFDTITGTGTGRYNGVSGATIEWTFTDAGEPGTADAAKIVITDSGSNTVLTVSGTLIKGNQQAHEE